MTTPAASKRRTPPGLRRLDEALQRFARSPAQRLKVTTGVLLALTGFAAIGFGGYAAWHGIVLWRTVTEPIMRIGLIVVVGPLVGGGAFIALFGAGALWLVARFARAAANRSA